MCDLLIDPYFFENAEGFTEAVNEKDIDTCRLLNTFLRPVVIHLRNRHELWFQLDGATCHAAKETMDVLQRMFGKNMISRRAAITWPPKSQDLNAPAYNVLRYLKERVYINRPKNLKDLKDNVRQVRSAMNYALVRARSCIAVETQHPRDVIFLS